ncbi:hypothetical protein LG047_19295, partial [Methylocystis sp. WRRC1]|uniref:hypothetical protein n=1 Tax=Methylocystis sp. WRRC1 TaxID=1732014 RepID=UPI001D159B03
APRLAGRLPPPRGMISRLRGRVKSLAKAGDCTGLGLVFLAVQNGELSNRIASLIDFAPFD